ncbi:response regulator [Sphingomonas sp. LB-2]|uniref:response regulator n=1 Tax=Sphingomonas caeni TaxID=2984949 RepID=UPI00222F92EC|nr:response regulator [Sphingomonas caeni]MCW3848584.1 response regulator [Sphingomonas caeni]
MASRIAPRGLTVLLVEDDEGVRRSLQLLLEWNGFDVRAHALAGSAMKLAPADYDLLVADYYLQDGDGIELLAVLRRAGWPGRAVLITARVSDAVAELARETGYHAVLEKPLARHELIAALTEGPEGPGGA